MQSEIDGTKLSGQCILSKKQTRFTRGMNLAVNTSAFDCRADRKIRFFLFTSILRFSQIAHSLNTFPALHCCHSKFHDVFHLIAITLRAVRLRQQSRSCNMAAGGSTQQHPSQVAVTLQSAPPVTSGVMSGPFAPLQIGQPGSISWLNAMYALDSRQHDPSTWDEVKMLQEALEPSIRSFTRITSRSPSSVPGSPWLSYASQLDILQRASDRFWSADRRPGAPPKLAGLAAWRGGILMFGEAEFSVTEEMTEDFMHAKLRGFKHRDRSSSWHQVKFIEQTHDHFQDILLAADARRGRLRAQVMEGNGQQDDSENITAILDNIVARDPERYLAWLSTMGYFYFTMSDHNPCTFDWEDWCMWKAPRSFEVCCKQASTVRRPPLGPGAIDRTKYGRPGDRPTITLEEAKKGNRRAMEFQDTADGMEVSQKEKAQYCMIGGEATSRETAVHFHAIRGEDVWLFDPVNSFKEASNDPSRQREAEVEVSFLCCR